MIRDDDDGLGLGARLLVVALAPFSPIVLLAGPLAVGQGDEVGAAVRLGVEDEGVGVGAADHVDDLLPVRRLGAARAPDDAHRVVRRLHEQRQARPDARARRHDGHGAEEPGHADHAELREAPDPDLLGRVLDHALRPVARVRHEDAKTLVARRGRGGRRLLLQVGRRRVLRRRSGGSSSGGHVGNDGKGVRLPQRRVREPDRLAVLYVGVLELELGGVAREDLGLDLAQPQVEPRVDDKQGDEDEVPKGRDPDGRRAHRDVLRHRRHLGQQQHDGPEQQDDGPPEEAVRVLEAVVEAPAHVRVRAHEDGHQQADDGVAKGQDDDLQRRHFCCFGIRLREEDQVQDVPHRRGHVAAGVQAAVRVDLGDDAPHTQGRPLGQVAKEEEDGVDKVLVAHDQGD